MSTVIVFGPTGGIGSVVARTAQEQGAKVVLAMRDPQKAIPGLSTTLESKFEKVQADLTNAESVSAAVQKTGAKRAFLYIAHGAGDHMRATLKALKAAGVEFVVLVSSYTVKGEKKDIPPSELISFIHAQAEVSLDEVFGEENYVALRPGGFATNFLRYKAGINSGKLPILAHDFKMDGITAGDIGRVGGTILVHGPRNDQRKVYLFGPQLVSQKGGVETIAKILGKDVQVLGMTEQEALEEYARFGFPKPVAEYVVRKSSATSNDEEERPFYKEGVENVQLYTGKPAETFEEWATANKELFNA